MVYLQSFALPTASQEDHFFLCNSKAKKTCYDSKYPFLLFKDRELPEFYFDDITIFYGDNGSGKSTLAKLFNAILLPTGGKVYVDGMDTADENNLLSVRATVGMVFQNPDNQIIGNIVEEDVGFGPENIGVPTEEIWKRVDESLKAVGMTMYRKQSPNHELNRVEGITMVLITHYMEEVVDADRVIVMDDGHIVMDGTPKEIFSRVEELKQYRMDVPQVTELAWELKKKGIPLPDGILRKSELLDALVPLLKEE